MIANRRKGETTSRKSSSRLLVVQSPPFFPGGGAERFPGAPMDEVTIAPRRFHPGGSAWWGA